MTSVDLSSRSVEFDVPATWVRVELDHPETWGSLTDEITGAVAVFRKRGLANGMAGDEQLGAELNQLCEGLHRCGIGAVAVRSFVANIEGTATLITGMVTLALAPAAPPSADVGDLLKAWQKQPDVQAKVVELRCGPALRVDLEVTGPGLLNPTPLPYRHTRFLAPVFDGNEVAVMVCSTPKAHAECFDLAFERISQTLRPGWSS